MANLFAAAGAVSPASAAAPAKDARQRVDPVTAVMLPAANRRGCWIVNRSDQAGSSNPPVPRFSDFRSPSETLGRAHLPRVRTEVVTKRRGYPSTYCFKTLFGLSNWDSSSLTGFFCADCKQTQRRHARPILKLPTAPSVLPPPRARSRPWRRVREASPWPSGAPSASDGRGAPSAVLRRARNGLPANRTK